MLVVASAEVEMPEHENVTKRKNQQMLQTRLTYNCAHLRSTKESLMFEYFDIYFFIERFDKIIFNFKSHFIQTMMIRM